MKKLVCAAVAALSAVLAAPVVVAQSYPSAPVRLVVGYPPGGASDIVGRLVAARLQERLGQPVVVENRPGANGNIGADYVAKAAPDGLTVGFGGGGPLTANAFLYKKLPYDPSRDFVMVGTVGRAALVLAAGAELGVKTLPDLLALLKKDPGRYTYGTPGNGSPQHLATTMLMQVTGTRVTHVPYKGATPMLNDMIAGNVHIGFDNVGMLPHVKSGRIVALAVAQEKRYVLYPDVPTFAEAGVPGIEAFTWYGMFAPRGTPDAAVERLNAELRHVLELPEIARRLVDLGIETMPGTPEQMRTFVAAESAKWGRLVRELGMTMD